MKEEEIVIPEGLESRLEALIDRLAEQETQIKRRRLWFYTSGIAAAIAVLLSLSVYFHTQSRNNLQFSATHTIENPEIAYLEAQKALKKVSLNFNKGMNQLAMVSGKVDKTNQILDKTFNK